MGPTSNSGAVERTATLSIASIMRLKAALRVAMPDLRTCGRLLLLAGEARGYLVVPRQIEVDDGVAACVAAVAGGAAARICSRLAGK